MPLCAAFAFTAVSPLGLSGAGVADGHRAPGSLSFTAVTARGDYGCEAAGPGAASGRESFLGSALRVTAGSLEIDTCPPNADCRATVVPTLSFSAPGFPSLDRAIKPGAFLEVEIETQRGKGCDQRLLIRSVPVWKGAPDPGGRALLLAAAHGPLASFDDAPFTVTADSASCSLRFVLARRGGPRVALTVPPTGEVIRWPVSRAESWRVWNGSAQRTGACGGSDGWSYWIAKASG